MKVSALPLACIGFCHLAATWSQAANYSTHSLQPVVIFWGALLLQIWDFKRAAQEGTLRGHGGDVRWCDWHPSKGAIASASKDNVIKLWDPRAGRDALATLQGHNATVMQAGQCASVFHTFV